MVSRAAQAVVMSLFLIFRPLSILWEPIKRPDPASIRKMIAEGGLKEIITFLGWKVNTRLFNISLTPEKATAWSNEVKALIDKRTVTAKELSQLIGKLNHVCFIIPDARHFMNNLRKMEKLATYKHKVKLSRRCLDDLDLWLDFLSSAAEGISINRVIFRKPTLTTFSDSSELGIGGYCPRTGFGWRYKLTELEQRTFTLNTKEYIASTIDMEFQAELDPNPTPFPCILNRSDSTSTVGWLRKSNHEPDEAPIHNEVARFHARNMMQRQACNYSQHLPGRLNIVADCLSRDFHLTDNQITSMLTSLHPSLSPSQLKIVPLPQKYISWVANMAQKWPGKRESPGRLIKSTIAAGVVGWNSPTRSNSAMTPIWRSSMKLEDYASAVLSCMQCDEVILGELEPSNESRGVLPDRPLTMWQRPLWKVVGAAPSSTPEERPTPTSIAKPKDTNETTLPPNTRKPSPQ